MKVPRSLRKLKTKILGDGRGPSAPAVLTRQLTSPFRTVWQWFAQSRQKRSYRNLWLGLPACVLAIGALAVAFIAQSQSGANANEYRNLAKESYEKGDLPKARVFLERVYRDGDKSDMIRYFLANTLQAQDEEARAQALFESLSPDDGIGYPDAHLLKASGMLSGRKLRENEIGLANHHLNAAQAKFGDTANWLLLRARYSLALGDHQTAIRLLRQAARKDPLLLYDLGLLCKDLESQGVSVQSEAALAEARAHFEKLLTAEPDEPASRLRLGRILSELGEFEESYKVLMLGLSRDEKTFGKALARVCLKHHDLMLRDGSGSPMNRLTVLKKATEYDNKCVEAVRRLAFFGEEPGATKETREAAKKYLTLMIATAEQPAIAHLALGSKAWADSEPEVALRHLRQAYEEDPSMTVLANNLAWVLSHSDSPDLEQALSVINSVLEKHPNVAAFRDTRGQILVKMQRWDDALKDLRFALRELRETPEIHGALHKVYTSINPPLHDLATEHKRIEEALIRRRGFGKP